MPLINPQAHINSRITFLVVGMLKWSVLQLRFISLYAVSLVVPLPLILPLRCPSAVNSRPLGHYVRRPGVGWWRLGAELDRHTPCACAVGVRLETETETAPFPILPLFEKEKQKEQWSSLFAIANKHAPSTYLPLWLYSLLYFGRGPLQISAGATTRVDGGASRFPIADPVSGPSADDVSARPVKKLKESAPLPRRLQTQIIGIYLSRCHRDDWLWFHPPGHSIDMDTRAVREGTVHS
jgi:hypothetical protein